jgi:hypothetical protein
MKILIYLIEVFCKEEKITFNITPKLTKTMPIMVAGLNPSPKNNQPKIKAYRSPKY